MDAIFTISGVEGSHFDGCFGPCFILINGSGFVQVGVLATIALIQNEKTFQRYQAWFAIRCNDFAKIRDSRRNEFEKEAAVAVDAYFSYGRFS